MNFVNRMTRTWPSTGWVSEWKNGGSPCLFYVALYGMCLLYPFEGGESPRLLVFRRDVVNAIFLKYSKKERLSSNRVGIRNIPLDVCYDETTHYRFNLWKARQMWQSVDAASWNVNYALYFWNISIILASFWL